MQPWGRGVDKDVVTVLTRGWQELWRPGDYAGPQPRIAEGAARDVDRWMEGEEAEQWAPG